MVIHRTVKTALVESIRNDIVRGTFPPGTHLRLDKLAERFDVSTMPIREALRVLEAEGIVYSVAHRGSFVTRFTSKEISDIYEMRAVLEKLATRDAVSRLTFAQLEQLQGLVDNWHRESSDFTLLVQQNTDFHSLIYQAAQRPHLYKEIMILRNRTHHYIHAFVEKVGRFGQAKQEHQAIVDAMKTGNAEVTAQLMYEHIWNVGQALADYTTSHDESTE